jgi:hypothetical protein
MNLDNPTPLLYIYLTGAVLSIGVAWWLSQKKQVRTPVLLTIFACNEWTLLLFGLFWPILGILVFAEIIFRGKPINNNVMCKKMNAELLAIVNEQFKPEDRPLVIQQLESITLDHVMAASESNLLNTRRAVLEISKGDTALLEHYVGCAKKDFRDVIYWASE